MAMTIIYYLFAFLQGAKYMYLSGQNIHAAKKSNAISPDTFTYISKHKKYSKY